MRRLSTAVLFAGALLSVVGCRGKKSNPDDISPEEAMARAAKFEPQLARIKGFSTTPPPVTTISLPKDLSLSRPSHADDTTTVRTLIIHVENLAKQANKAFDEAAYAAMKGETVPSPTPKAAGKK